MDFSPHLVKTYNSLTGRETKVEQIGEQQNPDGTTSPILQAVSRKDKDAIELIGDRGAKFICHELDYYYNPQSAMGRPNRDQVVELTADGIEAIFTEIFLNSHLYGVKNPSRLHAEEKNILNGLFLYLSGVADGGYADWGRDVISIKQSNIQQGNDTQQGGVIENIHSKLNR